MLDSAEDCRVPAMSDDDNDWDVEELANMEFEEKAVAEVIKCLEEEIARPSSFTAAVDTGGIYYQSPLHVTINGNEETCGPSFSDAASTMMASVDTGDSGGGGFACFYRVPAAGPWYEGVSVDLPTISGEKLSEIVDGVDEIDGEEWLNRLAAEPMIELEDDMLFE